MPYNSTHPHVMMKKQIFREAEHLSLQMEQDLVFIPFEAKADLCKEIKHDIT